MNVLATVGGSDANTSMDSDDHGNQHCLVCYSDLMYYAVTPCEHNEICAVCHLRLRFLHSDTKYPVCKATNEKIIEDPHNSTDGNGDGKKGKPFTEYPIWGDHLGDDFVYEQDVGMFFPLDYYHEVIQPLFGHHCTLPSCTYDGMLSSVVAETAPPAEGGNNQNKKSSKPVPPLRGL
jgi:hypothetical protein